MPENVPRRKIYLFVLLFAIVSVFFLRDTYWQAPLSEKEFVRLYVEAVKRQTRMTGQPLNARTETKKVLERMGVTEEQVNHFIDQVNKKPERWGKIWEKINKELEKASPAKDSTLPKNR